MSITEFFCKLFSWGNIIAALTGSFIGGVWWGIFYLAKIWGNYKRYSKYEGNYQSSLKTDLTSHQFDITLKRKGNKFIVSGKSISHTELIDGLIEMSTSIKNYGSGYYSHSIRMKESIERFGFYEIQLMNEKEIKILVHQNIKGSGKEDSAAYVWKKISDFPHGLTAG